MKRYFPVPFITFLSVSSLYAIYQLFYSQAQLTWLGTLMVVAPMLGFFIALYITNMARSSQYLPIQLAFTAVGLLLSLVSLQSMSAVAISAVGSIGNMLYIFWYTPLDRTNSHIQVNQSLPHFELHDTQGKAINLQEDNGQYQLLLFIRANWCPLCVAQVKELVDQYQQLQNLHCETYIISSQSEDNSAKLAQKMDAPIHFAVDKNNQAAKILGIEHIGGTPFGLPGYEANTALPTAIIVAPNKQVIFAHQTDDYRLRPEPETFIQAIQQHQNTKA